MTSLKEKLPHWIGDSFKQEHHSSFNNKKITELLTQVDRLHLLIYNVI